MLRCFGLEKAGENLQWPEERVVRENISRVQLVRLWYFRIVVADLEIARCLFRKSQ